MSSVVRQHAGDPARSRIWRSLGSGCAFRVLQRNLATNLVGDLLLDVGRYRREKGLGICRFRRGCQIGRLQRLRQQVVAQPERWARVNRIRGEIDAIVYVPRVSRPTPAIDDRRVPGVISPSIERTGVIVGRRVNAQLNSTQRIGPIETAVRDPVHVVRSLNEWRAPVSVGPLDIAVSVSVRYDSRAIRPLSYDCLDAARSIMDIHSMRVNSA